MRPVPCYVPAQGRFYVPLPQDEAALCVRQVIERHPQRLADAIVLSAYRRSLPGSGHFHELLHVADRRRRMRLAGVA